jgi:glycerol-3-phosphate acyltransferase PlsY
MGMTVWAALGAAAVAYLIGSVPIGVIVVRLTTGKDVLNEHSGRTGGTNVMRTAGLWAGLVTGLGDVFKGYAAVALARAIVPSADWLHAIAGVLAVLGHNHSIFLPERRDGRLRLRGGAGGASSLGAAIGMSPVTGYLILVVPVVLFGIGYASVTTLTIGLMATAVFVYQAARGSGPWVYVGFGLAAEALMAWALRPNLRRLARGEERLIGWRARRRDASDPPA